MSRAMPRLRTNLGLMVLTATMVAVLLFGSINFFWVGRETGEALASELEKRGVHLAQSLAAHSLDAVLLEDRLVLNHMIDDALSVDPEIAYIFLIGPRGGVVAHTFTGGFPSELLEANSLPPDRSFMVRRIVDTKGREQPIRDVVVPIAGGYAGFAHVGLKENLILEGVRRVERAVAVMVAGFVLLGMIGSVFFIKIVTQPLRRLAAAARGVNLLMLDAPGDSSKRLPSNVSLPFGVETEVDRLAEEFERMLERLATAYRQLEETHEQLVSAEKLSTIGRIAAGIAHEMNNPLTGLRNCMRRIRREPGNQEQLRRYLSVMEESAERMQRVVKGLLDLARPRAPDKTEIAMKRLLGRVVLMASHKLNETDVTARSTVESGLSVVWADEDQLERALLNLVLNACDSLESRARKEAGFEPKLLLRAACDNGRALLEVKDNGTGIAPDHLAHVFDPFFSTKAPGRGTGLGLSIAYDIVRAHGGDLTVESQPGDGACFRITLPTKELTI